jgi:hypothetical protein
MDQKGHRLWDLPVEMSQLGKKRWGRGVASEDGGKLLGE